MSKIIKYVLLGILGIIILTIAAIIILVAMVNPNRFKPFIVKAVYQSTGRNIALSGDISWKIYPNLGVNIKQVTLSNPSGFKESDFLSLNSADVSVGLLPLLSNHVVVKTLAIDGLNLVLIQEHGQNNWTFTPPSPETPNEGEPGGKPKPLKLDMSSFSLTNSALSYDNRDKHQQYALQKTNLVVDTGFGGGIKFDQASDELELNKVNFNYNDTASGKISLKVQQVTTTPQYAGDVEINKLRLNSLLNQFNIASKQRRGMTLLNNINFAGNVAGDKNDATLKEFSFNFSDKLKGKTSVVVKNFSNPSYSGNLNLDKFNLNQLLDSLNIAVAARKNKPLLNSFAFASDGFSGDMHNLNFKGVKISVGEDVKATFNSLQIKNFTNPGISGGINLPAFNLNKALDGLGIAVASRKNKPLLNSFAINTGFKASSSSLALSAANFRFGNQVHGTTSVQVQDFNNPKYSGNINLPTFSLNAVMQQIGMTPPNLSNKNLLNQIAISSGFAGSSNSLNLTQMNAKIGNSNVAGNVNVTNFKPLTFSENISIDKMDVADFSNINGYRLPLQKIQFNGNSQINSNMDLASLSGKQAMQIGNISVEGISLDRLVHQIDATIGHTGSNGGDIVHTVLNSAQVIQAVSNMKAEIAKATSPQARDLNQKTNLGNFSGSAALSNGLINQSAFKLAGPSVALNGNGNLNLAGNKAINYKANSQLLVSGINPIFKKLVFPTAVNGTINNPSASLDWSSIQQQLLKMAYDNSKQQIQQTVKQQINQALTGNSQGNPQNQQQNQAVDAVSKGVTNALGKLFGQ